MSLKGNRKGLNSLHKIQNGLCLWCGLSTWLPPRSDGDIHSRRATIEHIRPRSHGGPDKQANFAVACYGCNNRRGNRADELSARPAVLKLLPAEKVELIALAIAEGAARERAKIPAFLLPGYRYSKPKRRR